MDEGLAIRGVFEDRHSFAFTGACALAGAAVGAIWTGAVADARFGCFLAAANAGDVAAAGGRGAGTGAVAADAATGGLAAAGPGSGVMMLTGGVEDALGNSALVGLPVGADGGSPAMSPAPAGAGVGAFHDGA